MKLICTLGLIGALASASAWAQSSLANGIAVIVNKTIITYKDVENSIAPAVELLTRQFGQQPEVLAQKIQALQRERIEALVEQQIILHDFETAGYNLPESIIEDEIQKRIRADYTDRLTLTKTLQAQGVTYETYRQRIRNDIIVSAMSQKHIAQGVLISPHKIELYYEEHPDQFKVGDQVKLRMIVLNKSKDAPAQTVAIAQEILRKLEAGVPFAEMATVYSEGSQRNQGGDWGWMERSVLRKELVETAFSLKPGQRSDIIQTPDACWIMLVEELRPAPRVILLALRRKPVRRPELSELGRQACDQIRP